MLLVRDFPLTLQACPEHTSHHVGRLVQSILLASSDLAGGERSGVGSDGLSGLAGLKFSPTLRGHTYLTLGRAVCVCVCVCTRCGGGVCVSLLFAVHCAWLTTAHLKVWKVVKLELLSSLCMESTGTIFIHCYAVWMQYPFLYSN